MAAGRTEGWNWRDASSWDESDDLSGWTRPSWLLIPESGHNSERDSAWQTRDAWEC